jgi:hypothetical protein
MNFKSMNFYDKLDNINRKDDNKIGNELDEKIFDILYNDICYV